MEILESRDQLSLVAKNLLLRSLISLHFLPLSSLIPMNYEGLGKLGSVVKFTNTRRKSSDCAAETQTMHAAVFQAVNGKDCRLRQGRLRLRCTSRFYRRQIVKADCWDSRVGPL